MLHKFNNKGFAAVYKKKSSKAPASTTAPKFLVIKEWNVKIPLSNADSGAYYTAPATYGLVQDVSVFDKSIDVTTNSDGKSCKDGNYPLLAISRVKVGDLASVTDPNSPNFIADTGPADFKKVTFTAQYEFAGSTHNQAGPQCLTLQSTGNITKTEPTIEPKYTAVQQALIDSYNHLQAE